MPKQPPHTHANFQLGRDRLAAALVRLLESNELSHSAFEGFLAWCVDDRHAAGWLAASQVSSLRNAKLPKPGPQIFMALGAVNQGLYELTQGAPTRPLPKGCRHLADNPDVWFLAHPATGEPMGAANWFELYCGLLDCPELDKLPGIFTEDQAHNASQFFALLAAGWKGVELESGTTSQKLRGKFDKLIPEIPKARAERIWKAANGKHIFTAEELKAERDVLRFVVGGLLDRQALTVREFDRWTQYGKC
jgi:hypothetical protein